jgi:hypothetical protein
VTWLAILVAFAVGVSATTVVLVHHDDAPPKPICHRADPLDPFSPTVCR